MKSLAFLSAVTAIGVSLGVYACSNDDPGLNLWNTSGGSGATTSTSSGGTTASGSTTGFGSNTSTAKGGNSGVVTTGTGPLSEDASCGANAQAAELTPLYMVFLYDKSGSMGDDPNGNWTNRASRWDPMKQGMLDFFTNSGAVGIQASLKFFPAAGNKDQTCHADYKTAAMVPLSQPQPLVDALELANPGGGTPTLPAVMGGVAYAKQLMSTNKNSKAVVVLVTDGEPAIYNAATGEIETDCAPVGSTLTNTIPDIITVVSAAYRQDPPVLTYVIGTGEANIDSMQAIASAGGTLPSYIQLDATQPPSVTRAKLTETLKGIRALTLPCNMNLPSTFTDKGLVNVNFVHTDGTVEEFKKSADCGGAGWHFDNETTPTQIMLCPALCASVQKDLGGKLQILLDCETKLI